MSSIIQITDAASHSEITSQAELQSKPTIIYVSDSALPPCKTFTPNYESLISRYKAKYDIAFAQMENTPKTSMLFKFTPNQLPVLTLMCRERGGSMWAKTIMGANLKELESGIAEMLEKAGLLK